jgi:hypothetical protein
MEIQMKSLILTLSLFSCFNVAHAQMGQTAEQKREMQAAQALCHGMATMVVPATYPVENDDFCTRVSPTVYCCSSDRRRNDVVYQNGVIYGPIIDNGHYDPNARPVPNECHIVQHCVNNGYMAPPACGPQKICSYGPGLN